MPQDWLDWLANLLTPLLAPLAILMLGLGWLPGHWWVCPALSCSESVRVASRSDSFWCLRFPETRGWLCWLMNSGLMSLAHPVLCPSTHLLALQLLFAFLHFPPAETQHMADPTPPHPTSCLTWSAAHIPP